MALSILLMLVSLTATVTAEQPVDPHQMGKAKPKKMTPFLEDKIQKAGPGETIPIIIFYKNRTYPPDKDAKNKLEKKVKEKGGMVKRKYQVIKALAAELNTQGIQELVENPDVDRIFYDEIIQINPAESETAPKMDVSAPTIGADVAWNSLGYTGSGVKVAVIDTGVNYSHPDLGGGLGTSYRIIGGYDFYNNDADPMDDHGHGTHVAGTIGANGSIKGIAPNSSLLAVKVCSASGSCPTSTIIAGIDWSIAQGADIISMSLGGNAQPNDEFQGAHTIVADQAVDRGVVVVIAGGNEGPGTGTIGRPGSGRKVITVSATDDKSTTTVSDDNIASFSNRGPSAFGRLDPELVAPGVSINSTCLTSEGGYCLKSGTSMATPHVSGAAALLLEKDPDLTPAEVRRILMHTSTGLTAAETHVFEEGSGIINVTRALISNLSATIDGANRWEASVLPGHNATATLNITNNGLKPVNLSITSARLTDLEGDKTIQNTSITMPSSIELAAGSDQTIKLLFTAPGNADPGVYGTTIVLSNDSTNTLRIPIVMTIPLVGSGMVNGSVDDNYLDSGAPFYSIYEFGDWIYYAIFSPNSTSITASLNWTDPSDDLDLYLYAPNGETTASSTQGSGTSEQVNLSNPVYNTYWLAIHAWSLSGTGSYNLTVEHPAGGYGALTITPTSWEGQVGFFETRNITFTIMNDATAKSGVNATVNYLSDGDDYYTSQSIGAGYTRLWRETTSGTDTTYTRYMNATLRWDNQSNDLNLYFSYYNGTTWILSRLRSEHYNNASLPAVEELKNMDIQHYLKTYTDVGIYVNNVGGATVNVNLTLNLTDVAPWLHASVNDTGFSLASDAIKQLQVSVNGSALEPGLNYQSILMLYNNDEDYAILPLDIYSTSLYDSKDLSPPSSDGSWTTLETVNLNGTGWHPNQSLIINITYPNGSNAYYGVQQADWDGSLKSNGIRAFEIGGIYNLYASSDSGDTWTYFDSFTVTPSAPELPNGAVLAIALLIPGYLIQRKN